MSGVVMVEDGDCLACHLFLPITAFVRNGMRFPGNQTTLPRARTHARASLLHVYIYKCTWESQEVWLLRPASRKTAKIRLLLSSTAPQTSLGVRNHLGLQHVQSPSTT